MRQQQPLNPEPQPAKPKWKYKRQTHKLEEEAGPPLGIPTSVSRAKPQVPPVESLPVNYDLSAVGTDKKVDPYLVSVDINGATMQIDIDTGSP